MKSIKLKKKQKDLTALCPQSSALLPIARVNVVCSVAFSWPQAKPVTLNYSDGPRWDISASSNVEREAEKLVSEMKCEEDSPAITHFDSGKRATVCGGL